MFKVHAFCAYAFLALWTGTAVLAQDGDTYEKILDDQIKAMQDLNTVLKDVKDVETATKSKAGIEKIADDMKAIKARADKLGKPTPEQEKTLKEKYETQVQKEAKDLLGHIFRIGKDPEAAKIVQAALEKTQS